MTMLTVLQRKYTLYQAIWLQVEFSLYLTIYLPTYLKKTGNRYSAGLKIIKQTTPHGLPTKLIDCKWEPVTQSEKLAKQIKGMNINRLVI